MTKVASKEITPGADLPCDHEDILEAKDVSEELGQTFQHQLRIWYVVEDG